MRWPDSASIFTAEIWTVIKVLEEIKISVASKDVVFTKSISWLQALQCMKLVHPLIGMVIRKCVVLNFDNKNSIFFWGGVPNHTDIRDNEQADCAAKSALMMPHDSILILNIVSWQDDWNCAVANKLPSIKPVLGDWQSYRRCKKGEIVLCRAYIGHTHLIHSCILNKDPPPQCEHCQCILTVRHILVECSNFTEKMKKYMW